MIKIENLTKTYGEIKAIEDISFTINQNEIVGFLGPNGAGKTTTMNILTGYISSNKGNVFINGFNMNEEPEKAKKNIGYLPDTPPLYSEFLVKEYLKFVCELKKVNKKDIKEMISKVIEMSKLDGMENRMIKNLSKGYKQRVGIAQALVGFPKVLIFDEPTTGLDPNQIIEIRDLIKELGKNHTIILSSHILSEVSAICDKIIILNKGKIVAMDSTDNLVKTYSDQSRLFLRIKGERTLIEKNFHENSNINKYVFLGSFEKDSYDYDIYPVNNLDLREELFFDFSKNSIPLLNIKSYILTLEEIFINLTNEKIILDKIEKDEIFKDAIISNNDEINFKKDENNDSNL